MSDEILVIGSLSSQGKKVVSFLERAGLKVFGVDRFGDEKENKASRFFRMDLRHRESVDLLMRIVDPEVVILCWCQELDQWMNPDSQLIGFWRVLSYLGMKQIKKIVVSVDQLSEPIKTPNEVSQWALIKLGEVFTLKDNIDFLVITKEDNLLKKINDFIKK